jgi:putative aldouronate transport system permease protein
MQNRKRLIDFIKRDWQLYLFLMIPVVYMIIFAYLPMGGIVIAFKDYVPRKGIFGSEWVGFLKFKEFFNSLYFKRTLLNTLILSVYSIIVGFPIPVIMALMLNCLKSKLTKNVVQTIVTLPHFISTVVLVGIMFQIFSARNGLYGNVVLALTGSYPPDPFSIPSNFRHFYVWSGVWQEFGWGSIIYLASLSTIDPHLHEAAIIDGASRFKRVVYIDLPGILPTVIIMLILRMGRVMSIGFEKVFLMQNGINLQYSEIISTYVYKVGLAAGGTTDFSYATAIGFFNSIINMILIVIVNAISRKVSENSLW